MSATVATTLLRRLADLPSDAPMLLPPDAAAGPVWRARDVSRAADDLARGLRASVAVGDRVGVLLPSGPAFLVTLLALWRLRAAALVLTTLHPEAERARLLDDADASLVLDDAALAALAPWTAGGPWPAPPAHSGDRVADPPPGGDAGWARPDDLALLVYTSGTTSRPKGVALRHRHLLAQTAAIADAWALGPGDLLLHALPLHHVHGLVIALLSTLRSGGGAILLPRFDAAALLARAGDATVFMGVPTMYARLLDHVDALDATPRAVASSALRGLRLCVSGSAGLPVSLGERWRALTGCYPVERFGMTELGVALSNRLDDRRPGRVGWPLAGVEVRVVDDAGGDAVEGELQVRGATVFDGYWRRPEADAEAFEEPDGRRWFRTGDTVRRDEDGCVSVLGRTSVDILKTAGYKVSAIQVEEALRAHPGVHDVAVVGLPDETYGQVVAAAVVARPGVRVDLDALAAHARRELAPYQAPRRYRLVDDLPRNALGKVVKPALLATWVADGAPT